MAEIKIYGATQDALINRALATTYTELRNFQVAKNKEFEDFLNEESVSFENFIMTGFSWFVTPSDQGSRYWMTISDRPEPTEAVLIQFIPTLDDIKTVLNSEKLKDSRCVYRGDHYYLINADEILDLILELQKQK